MSEAVTDRFRALATEFNGSNSVALGNALTETERCLEEAAKVKTELETRKEYLRLHLAEKLDEEGLKNITLADGTRYRSQEEMFVSATAEFKPNVMQVLKDTGNGSIIKEDFNAATFKALVKSLKPEDSGMPNPVLVQLLGAGMQLRVVNMARRY